LNEQYKEIIERSRETPLSGKATIGSLKYPYKWAV
jgi:hypothetical protein